MIETSFSRREVKFFIDASQRRRLLAFLAERVIPDAHGNEDGCYPVVSLYFDNRSRDMYWDQLIGVGSRQKLRLRTYGSPHGPQVPASFLEIKHKLDGRTIKQRVATTVDEGLFVAAGHWPEAAVSPRDAHVIRQIHALVAARELRPCCVLRYDRQAFRGMGDAPDLRITLDTRIRYRFDDLVPRPADEGFTAMLFGRDRYILEVKVDHAVPRWLAEAVGACGCVPQGFSKYAEAVTATTAQARSVPAPATVSRRPKTREKRAPKSTAWLPTRRAAVAIEHHRTAR